MMKGGTACFLCVLALFLCSVPGWSQKEPDKTVSGPDQWNSKKSTGKSYKKGTERNPAKQDDSKTGQTRTLGNTADLAKNGNDVNGQRGEDSKRSKKPQEPGANGLK